MTKAFLAALTIASAAAAHADPLSGNLFLGLHEKNRMAATFYVVGVLEGQINMGIAMEHVAADGDKPLVESYAKAARLCIPPEVTPNQLTAVFVKALNDRPGNRHLPAATLAHFAFLKEWPCAVGASQ